MPDSPSYAWASRRSAAVRTAWSVVAAAIVASCGPFAGEESPDAEALWCGRNIRPVVQAGRVLGFSIPADIPVIAGRSVNSSIGAYQAFGVDDDALWAILMDQPSAVAAVARAWKGDDERDYYGRACKSAFASRP